MDYQGMPDPLGEALMHVQSHPKQAHLPESKAIPGNKPYPMHVRP